MKMMRMNKIKELMKMMKMMKMMMLLGKLYAIDAVKLCQYNERTHADEECDDNDDRALRFILSPRLLASCLFSSFQHPSRKMASLFSLLSHFPFPSLFLLLFD